MSMNSPTQDEIEQVAYRLWQERGAPIGSPEVDWERAEQELTAQGNGGTQNGGAAAQNGSAVSETGPPGAATAGATAKGRRGQRAEHNS